MRRGNLHYDGSLSVGELGPWSAYERAPSPPETRVWGGLVGHCKCAIT